MVLYLSIIASKEDSNKKFSSSTRSLTEEMAFSRTLALLLVFLTKQQGLATY
jgi:hypothetical protein